MSGSTSVAMTGGGGGGDLFTAVQWQELEHQALIYKYLVAGVPVPSDLVQPIRTSLQALSATFFNNLPTLGPYCSYYGKKFDPEPGRCRRTDGKKWRCSKDAYHESKYCEKHMHRGRNRSRKPVESQSNSKSLSTSISQINNVNNKNVSSAGQSLYSVTNSGGFDFGSNGSKLQVDTGPYVIHDIDLRYSEGLTVNVNGQNYPSGGNMRGLSMEDANVNSSWGLMPSQIPTNLLLKPQNDSYSQNNSLHLNMANTSEPMIDTTSMLKKSQQQHCFLGNEIESPKHVNHSMGPFLGQWPKAEEPWSNLDAATQLSISMDPDFNARNACPSNDT